MKAYFNTVLFQVLLLFAVSGGIYAQTVTEDLQYLATVSEYMDVPLRVAADGQGFIYVADASMHSVFKYDATGSLVETIDVVELPVSVALNNEGLLFIGDGATGFIFKYDQSNGATEFYKETMFPSSMEFGPDNTLYVADSRLQQVLVIDLSGNLLRTIGTGTLDFPTGVTLDNKNKQILVGEHGGAGTGFSPTVRVHIFDFQGNLISNFGSHGNGDGQFYRIQGLTVGKCGNIYVVDPYQARISVFDESGVFITKFGDFGLLDGELNVPMDIVFDPQGRILVTSMNNGALELFSISDTLPSSNIRSGSAMICAGEFTDIEVAFTGTAPWSFTYTLDGLNPTIVNTTENPYTLTVSDGGHYEVVALSDANYSGSCFTGSADVLVTSTVPTAHMTGDAVICEGDSTEISVGFTGSAPWNFSYTHDGGDPVPIITTNNPYTFKVSEAGLYSGSALGGGGCQGSSFTGSAAISVDLLPMAVMTDGNNQVFIDPGESADLPVELTGSPPWAITYTVDDLDPVSIGDINEGVYSIISSKTGTYEVKEVTDSRCTSYTSLGYPEVVLNPGVELPTAHMEGGELTICPGESVPISIEFTGNAPWTFSYAVDTLMTTTIFNTYTNPYIINAIYGGDYEVIALSDSQYEGTEFTGYAHLTVNPFPVPGFGYISDLLEVSFTNTSTYADSYVWDFGDANSSTEISPIHQYENAGDYIVSLTATNNCGDLNLWDTINVQAVTVESLEFDNLLRIYPNPSGGLVTIEMHKADMLDWTMEIIGTNGRVIYSNIHNTGVVVEELDLSVYPDGLYFVRIISKEYVGIKKLILNTR